MVCSIATVVGMAKDNGGMLLLRFDDRNFPAWERALPLFEKYGAHATFFIYGAIDDQAVATMRKLKAAGHSLGAHGLKHRKVVDALKKLGEREYLEQELRPQLVAAKNAGVPLCHFGYPCSQRDEQSDALLLARFDRIVGGGYWKEAKAGDIDRCDELFVPVAEASRRRMWIGASVGTCAPSITGEMARVIHRLANRGEAALFYTHNIVGKSPHAANDVSFQELEFILRTAKAEGVRVCGLDDLGGEVLHLKGCFPSRDEGQCVIHDSSSFNRDSASALRTPSTSRSRKTLPLQERNASASR